MSQKTYEDAYWFVGKLLSAVQNCGLGLEYTLYVNFYLKSPVLLGLEPKTGLSPSALLQLVPAEGAAKGVGYITVNQIDEQGVVMIEVEKKDPWFLKHLEKLVKELQDLLSRSSFTCHVSLVEPLRPS